MRSRAFWPALVLALALTGCATPGHDDPTCAAAGGAGEITLVVTADFGRELVHRSDHTITAGSNVMDVLVAATDGRVRAPGGYVESMFGRDNDAGRKVAWFFEVDGQHASCGAASFGLAGGETIQWDHRTWRTPVDIPGLFGSFVWSEASVQTFTAEDAPWNDIPGVHLDGDRLVTPQGTLDPPWGLSVRAFPLQPARAVMVDGGFPPPTPITQYGVASNTTMTLEITPW